MMSTSKDNYVWYDSSVPWDELSTFNGLFWNDDVAYDYVYDRGGSEEDIRILSWDDDISKMVVEEFHNE